MADAQIIAIVKSTKKCSSGKQVKKKRNWPWNSCLLDSPNLMIPGASHFPKEEKVGHIFILVKERFSLKYYQI